MKSIGKFNFVILLLIIFCLIGATGCTQKGENNDSNSEVAESSGDVEAVKEVTIAGVWTSTFTEDGTEFNFIITISDDGIWNMVQRFGDDEEQIGEGKYSYEDGEVIFYSQSGTKEFDLKLSSDQTKLFDNNENEPEAYNKAE